MGMDTLHPRSLGGVEYKMTTGSILTIEQAAEFLGIDRVETLRKLARNGEIPAAN